MQTKNVRPGTTGTIDAVILAGGRARRLGGRDKGLLQVDHRRLIELSLANVAPQVDRVIINANRHLDQYRDLGYDVVPDVHGHFAGPLAGILTALEFVRGDYLLVVSCDTPLIPSDLVERLYRSMQEHKTDICCVRFQGRLQPLVSLLDCRVKASLQRTVQNQAFKVMDWVKQQSLSVIELEPGLPFINLNTEQDLQQLQQLL